MAIKTKRLLECFGWIILGHSIGWWCCHLGDQARMETPEITYYATQPSYRNNSHHLHNNINSNNTIPAIQSSQQHSSSSYPFDSPIKFVFFIGLEGTGHHLVQGILKGSPASDRINSMQTMVASRTSIQTKLFHRPLDARRLGDIGLWNAHCNSQRVIDTVGLKEKLSNTFRLMIRDLKRNYYPDENDGNETLIFPVNTLGHRKAYGMVSYPNFGGKECRFLMYPNLGLFYDACDAAEVDCEHIYLYRDPLQILRSTTLKRNFNTNMNMAIHLYTTMLYVVESQLEMYQNRTLGCYGFYETNNDTSSWREDVRRLFWGWQKLNNTNTNTTNIDTTNQTTGDGYDAFIDKVYRPPLPVVNESLVVSSDFQAYVSVMNKIHDRGVRLCNVGLAKRKKSN
jgi:hypothetical protein